MLRSGHVNTAMRSTRIGLAALALLAVAGCSGPAKSADKGPAAPVKPGPTKEEAIKEALDKGSAAPPGAYDIKKPGEGWDAASASLVGLGKGMDEAMVPKQPLLCKGSLYYDDPTVGNLRFSPQQIKIQDLRNFDIEYALPETKSAHNRMRANGTRRVMLRDEQWKALPAFSSTHRRLTEGEVKAFPRQFPETMFASLKDNADVWSSLFDAWASGVGGYKAKLEEQSFTEGGKKRSQYRILATTNEGGPTEVEVIVDKEKLRPLTVRVNGTASNGKEYRMMWTGSWLVGGKFDAKDFVIPKVLPSSSQAS